jgi:ABC-type multidrug transport system ATPase subunit
MIGISDVYLFDEPTSGLSSKDSEHVLEIIRSLARNKIVITSIHQPSMRLLQMFDKALLLDKGGKMAYFGTPQGMLEYFWRVYHTKPATRAMRMRNAGQSHARLRLRCAGDAAARHQRRHHPGAQRRRPSRGRASFPAELLAGCLSAASHHGKHGEAAGSRRAAPTSSPGRNGMTARAPAACAGTPKPPKHTLPRGEHPVLPRC